MRAPSAAAPTRARRPPAEDFLDLAGDISILNPRFSRSFLATSAFVSMSAGFMSRVSAILDSWTASGAESPFSMRDQVERLIAALSAASAWSILRSLRLLAITLPMMAG